MFLPQKKCHPPPWLHSRQPPLLGVLAMLGLAFANTGFAEVTVIDPGTFVVDRAGIIEAQHEAQLETTLKLLEQKTTTQIKVLTVQTTEGEDWFQFVQRHYDLWKLGQRGKDNGAIIALTVGERHVRIHTGYGLEGVLPDAWCGSASRQVRDEFFRRGAYSPGLQRLTMMVATKVADDAGVKLEGAIRFKPQVGFRPVQFFALVPFILVFLFILLNLRRQHARRNWRGRGHTSTVWTSGWGSSGGGFGGGFGGGGGSFGGGGMSGGGGGGASW